MKSDPLAFITAEISVWTKSYQIAYINRALEKLFYTALNNLMTIYVNAPDRITKLPKRLNGFNLLKSSITRVFFTLL